MLTKAKSFLSSWKNLLALGTLILLGGWIYSRVWMVNPAILGDEYLYSINARKAAPWDPSPAGDFSNYLFNFVYQGTNLCGEAFYTCGKIFNLFFFLGFIFTLFIVAIRFLPFWAAYGFMIAAGLSPLSVYTSMFLPESMYMFFIGLLLIAVLRAMKEFTWQNWAIAGGAIGLASLVKPHAWLSAIAVGITLLVVGLGNREIGFKKTTFAVGALLAGAALSRIAIGLLVAGPKALGFFGQYLGFETVNQVLSEPLQSDLVSGVGAGPVAGILAIFIPQITIHVLVVFALMALSVIALIVNLLVIAKTRILGESSKFALFAFIWLFSLMIEIVIFTGWVTGGGDDHTTRVLLRYYEFLFLIVPLASMSALATKIHTRANVWVRWSLAGLGSYLLTPAFTGFFSSLTIQIADAPTLAGLVVNADVFNATAVVTFFSLVVFATFPKYALTTFLLVLPASLIGTGWQIQDQYQMFRGNLSGADRAGQYVSENFDLESKSRTWIASTSRFEATNVAIWVDDKNTTYGLFNFGTEVTTSEVPEGTNLVVVTSGLSYVGPYLEKVAFDDEFTVFRIQDNFHQN